ncbi:MAG: hypothetical protein LBV27_07595 [Oscillospiraceae bacterium]|jgi:hypothetical protein|nr:hypothetical protein [Oscillospiraceae bacterium]
MSQLINQLYINDIDHTEEPQPYAQQKKTAKYELEQYEKEFIALLPDKAKEMLMEMEAKQSNVEWRGNMDAYVRGFKTGALLIAEIFA